MFIALRDNCEPFHKASQMEPQLCVAVANLITYNLSAPSFPDLLIPFLPLAPWDHLPPNHLQEKTFPGFSFQENPKCPTGLRKLNKAKHLSVSQPQELVASQWGGESSGLQEHHMY